MPGPADSPRGCVHMLGLNPYEASLVSARFAALRRAAKVGRADLRVERWASNDGCGLRAGPCTTCGLSRLARGDDLMACLHCSYVGCWSPLAGRRDLSRSSSQADAFEGRHIKWHLVREGGHWLAAHVDRLEVYCSRCGDFVADPQKSELGLVPFSWRSAHPLVAPGDKQRCPVDTETWWAEQPPHRPEKRIESQPPVIRPPRPKRRRGSHGWLSRCLESEVPTLSPIVDIPRGTEERMAQHNRHGLRGFLNMGNTCFMSCILQVLVHNPAFQAYFLHGGHERCPDVESSAAVATSTANGDAAPAPAANRSATPPPSSSTRAEQEPCLACEMGVIFASMFANDENDAVVPHRMLYATWKFADRLAGYEQQDAHEFLMVLLDALALHVDKSRPRSSSILKDDGKVDPKTLLEQRRNFVHEVFCGSLKSELVCQVCGHTSTTREPFLDLSLALCRAKQPSSTNDNQDITTRSSMEPVKIEDCLSRFTSAETLPELAWCPACAGDVKRTKQLSIEKLPNVLVVHLKRFDALRDRKICDPVSFPLQGLDLSPQLSPFCRKSDVDRTKHSFDLAAVVNHDGGDLARGHYTCFVKEGGKWFVCDDTKVSPVQPDEVAKSQGYILFYVRSDLANLRTTQLTAQLQKFTAPGSVERCDKDQPSKPAGSTPTAPCRTSTPLDQHSAALLSQYQTQKQKTSH